MASFKEPNSEVYFLTVPFSSDYKNVIDFSSATAQYNAFMGITGKKHFTKLNIIRPTDTILYIKEDFGEYYKYNYIMFRNPLLSNKWFYAFITDAFYNAENVTEIHYMLDVWQTFQFDITYYRCMIERGIVAKNEDSYDDWLQPEPLNVQPFATGSNLNVVIPNVYAPANWQPTFLLEALSYPAQIKDIFIRNNEIVAETDQGGVFVNSKYTYGGSDNKNNTPSGSTSALFGIELDTSWLSSLGITTKGWYWNYSVILDKYGDLVDHRTDILNIRILPKWVYDTIDFVTPYEKVGDNYVLDPTIPRFAYKNDMAMGILLRADLTNTKLNAVDYTPRNKKMLSSLSKTFLLYNENQTLMKQFLPEYITDNTFFINGSTRPIGSTNIKLQTFNYAMKQDSIFYLPYNMIFTSAYNSNVGVQKALGVINAGLDVAQGVAHLTESVYGLQGANLAVDFAQTRRQPRNVGTSEWGLYKQKDIAFQKSGREEHGLYMLNSIQDTFNAGVSLAQSLSAQTKGTSTQPDMLTYTASNCELQIREINPNLEDCKVIDTFLDMYGYSINEVDNIGNWTNTRSKWNYVKTQGANLKVKASDAVENTIKAIFNNGVTIWHSFSAFGKYNPRDRTDGYDINE